MSNVTQKNPHGFTELPIADIFQPLEDGRTMHQGWSPQCEREPASSDDIWGVLKTTSIQPGEFQPEHNKCLPHKLTPRPLLEVKPGDILMTCAGPRGRCGIACLVRSTRPRLMISGKMYRFRVPTDKYDPRYIEAFLQTEIARVAIDKMKTGISESGLNLTHARFRKLPVPIVPLNEQRLIIAEIEKQFTRLNAGIEALKRVRANLKRYRASILKSACEGKLVSTEAELAKKEKRKHETGAQLLERILKERRRRWNGRGKYKEPLAPDVVDLPTLPEGWVWATAEQLSDENRSITYGVIKLGSQVPNGISVLRSSDVRHLKLDLDGVKRISPKIANNYQRTFLRGGEILITVRGTLGGVVIVPTECTGFNISREVAMLDMIEPRFAKIVAIFIASTQLQRWLLQRAKGIAYTGINIETLKRLPIPLPPETEQKRIVAEVERRLTVIESLEKSVVANLQRATRLRQSVLQQAFSGKLVVQKLTQINAEEKASQNRISGQPNRHFARSLLSAEIVHQLYPEPTFGRTKHQKIFHLCEHIARIEEIEGVYHREAAGPLDNKLIYANEKELKKQKWYEEFSRDSYGHAYRPLAKAGGHQKYLEKYWAGKLPIIQKLIKLMRSWTTDQCEIFSTTYAAWNDLILWGKEPTEDAILHEVWDRWHIRKKRFSQDLWRKAIAWIKKEGFVPTGFGKPTCQPQDLS